MPEALSLDAGNLSLTGLAWGTSDKPALIMLHGWLDNAASFTYLAPLLSDDYYVIALDLPGHGYSGHLPPPADYQHVHVLEYVLQAVDSLGYQRAIWLGHSLGGVICSLIASTFPERVEKLISIDAIGPLSDDAINGPAHLAQSIKRILRRGAKAAKTYPDLDSMLHARMRASGFNEQEARPIVERHAKQLAQGGFQWRFDRQLLLPSRVYLTEAQVCAYLTAIQSPVLLIEAEQGIIHDNSLVNQRKRVFQQLQVRLLAGHHHLHLQYPDKVALEIHRFLRDNSFDYL